MTHLRNPNSAIGSAGRRSPRSTVYSKWIESLGGVPALDVDTVDVEDLRDLVADQVVHGLRCRAALRGLAGRC